MQVDVSSYTPGVTTAPATCTTITDGDGSVVSVAGSCDDPAPVGLARDGPSVAGVVVDTVGSMASVGGGGVRTSQ